MEQANKIALDQEELGQQISKLYVNLKKDSAARKTGEYLETKTAILEDCWTRIEDNNDKIIEVNVPNHGYFTKKYFEQLKKSYEMVKMYIEECQGKIKTQEKESADSPASMEVEIEAFRQLADKITAEMTKVQCKIQYKILQERLEREWVIVNKESEKKNVSARSIQNSIGDLYDQIRRELLIKIDQLERKGTQSWDMPLPQITIPHFFGRYEEWNTFSDLFQKMIHLNDKLSNAQKMQHLKAYVRGEASKLIQHLCIAENNYETAWNLLKNRYYNERLLITKLLDSLLDMPEVRDGSAKELKELHDTTNECLQAITNMGVPTESWGPMMTRIVTRKWDQETRRAYEQSLKNSHEIENFTEMMNFLQQRFQSLEACSHENRRNGGQLEMTTSKKEECKFCKEQHWIQYCQKFKNLTALEKNQVVREKNICKQCLSHYNDKRCHSTRSCQICRRQHHTMLHLEQQKPANSSGTTGNKREKSKSSGVLSHLGRHDKSILITTALVNAVTIFGTREILRVLVDPGSQASFITEQAAQLVGKPKQKIHAEVSGLGDATPKISNYKINLKITPRFSSGFAMNVDLLVLPKLTESLPQNSIDTDLQEWRNYMLADPTFNKSGPIDIILGAKEYGEILVNGLYKSTKGLVAQNTELGWILSGPINGNSMNTIRIQSMITRAEEDQQLTKFWELEEISVPRKLTKAEEVCEEHFEKTVQRKEDGTYVVQIPFKEETTCLGDSRNRAMARLMQLEKKFTKNEKLKIAYNQFMQEYIDLGHMTKIPFNAHNEGKYYIPHQPVIREESTTTKLRVVFDASCKTSSGVSLNEIMHVGPRLQQELFDILLRWRTHQIAFTADIEKMYRQIRIENEDQEFQRILWRFNSWEPVEEYKLATVTYGTASAPYLAIKTIQTLARDEETNFSEASKTIMRDFYVDDVLSGADTEADALHLQKELITLMKNGGFTLRKWSSNNAAMLESLPPELRDQTTTEIKQDDTKKSLGVHWAPCDDTIRFKVETSSKTPLTKRVILSDVAKIFDPMGWLAPIVVTAKMFIQELWVQKFGWDDNLPKNIQDRWESFRDKLRFVETIRLPRWTHQTKECPVELHGFCDASEKAYGAVVYAKIKNLSTGNITITLLCAKSKVAPTKGKTTLPRLELCSAVLLAKLMKKTIKALDMENAPVVAWSDSMISVAWIKGDPSRWKTFVANRVSEIIKILPGQVWRHVKTKDNPADLISRGIDPSKLENSSIWWKGPTWLTDENCWPNEENLVEPEEEVRKYVAITTCVEDDDMTQRFSSLNRMLRVLSYCRRFMINATKRAKLYGPLKAQELEDTLLTLIKTIQIKWFGNEYTTLQKGDPINKKSILSNLSPFIDPVGVIRVGGRLQSSSLPYNEKHPIIIPRHHNLTKLLIDNAHKTMMHGGNQTTLAYLRRKFWIINGKKTVSSFIQKCTRCIRFKAQTLQQKMGDLPASRVNPSPPFSHTGIDYAGPIQIKATKGRGHKSYKGYIAVFVCFATKAIHLEVVSDMTTDTFLAAFRRFTARRGNCSHIYSDNGTTFVGAHKHLYREVRLIETNQEVQDYFVTNGTQWHFIPPSAPHFGGLWEAGVKSMKHHMKRIIGDATLTYEELTTLMHQIEACLNSRPLTALTDNTDDIQALTPGHFLIGRELVTPPDPIDTPINSNISSRWRLVQKLKKDLWKAWSSEYLSRLQQRYKWKTPEHNAQIGDLVLIKEDIKPSRWPLARVTEVHPGKDGAVRVISMKKADGTTVKRAIHKTIPLPVNSDVTVGAENNTPQKVNSNSATTRKSQITEMRNKKTDLFLQDKVNSTRY